MAFNYKTTNVKEFLQKEGHIDMVIAKMLTIAWTKLEAGYSLFKRGQTRQSSLLTSRTTEAWCRCALGSFTFIKEM